MECLKSILRAVCYTCAIIIHQNLKRSCLSTGVSHGDFCYLFQVEHVLAGDVSLLLFLSCSTALWEVRISTPAEGGEIPGKEEISFII